MSDKVLSSALQRCSATVPFLWNWVQQKNRVKQLAGLDESAFLFPRGSVKNAPKGAKMMPKPPLGGVWRHPGTPSGPRRQSDNAGRQSDNGEPWVQICFCVRILVGFLRLWWDFARAELQTGGQKPHYFAIFGDVAKMCK